MYIHCLILLIGFEGVYSPKPLTKHITLVEFIGCNVDVGCFFEKLIKNNILKYNDFNFLSFKKNDIGSKKN